MKKFKPVVHPYRRLNPNIKEVVKSEVIKLLDVEVIYTILDISWDSPVQESIEKRWHNRSDK